MRRGRGGRRRLLATGRPGRQHERMTSAGPPDLTRARQDVLARIAGSGMNQDPHLEAPAPLRALPPELEAKLTAGPPTDVDLRRRVVGPSAALAVLDAIAVVVAIAAGHVVLAIVAGVLFVPLAALAVLGARYGGNRLTMADRARVAAASKWRSRQDWSGPLGMGDERGLVIAAVHAAGRIAATPGWRSGRLDEQRVRLDLATELDQIDDQAHRIATARVAGHPGTAADAAWTAALDRVAALTAYADELDGTAQRQREAAAAVGGDPVRDEQLLTGATLDGFALENLVALTLFLGAQQPDP